MNPELVKLLQMSSTELASYFKSQSDTIIHQVNTAVTANDENTIRILAYLCLNVYRSILRAGLGYDIYKKLQEQPIDLSGIRDKLLSVLPRIIKDLTRFSSPIEKQQPVRPNFWGKETGVRSDESINIIHGGGLLYITAFLSGKVPGYRLEVSGEGIQVHPLHSSVSDSQKEAIRRSRHDYPLARSKQSLDWPITLTATIDASYLDEAKNKDEAGLRTDYITKLRNINIELLQLGQKAAIPNEVREHIRLIQQSHPHITFTFEETPAPLASSHITPPAPKAFSHFSAPASKAAAHFSAPMSKTLTHFSATASKAPTDYAAPAPVTPSLLFAKKHDVSIRPWLQKSMPTVSSSPELMHEATVDSDESNRNTRQKLWETEQRPQILPISRTLAQSKPKIEPSRATNHTFMLSVFTARNVSYIIAAVLLLSGLALLGATGFGAIPLMIGLSVGAVCCTTSLGLFATGRFLAPKNDVQETGRLIMA